MLHDATIQLDVASLTYDGGEIATAMSALPPIAAQGAFADGLVPAKILGSDDINGGQADGRLEVFFFDTADSLTFITDPAQVDSNDEIDFQALMDGTQLNATANTTGTFQYNPPVGSVLDAGQAQELSVTFTPDNLAAFDVASATVCSLTCCEQIP